MYSSAKRAAVSVVPGVPLPPTCGFWYLVAYDHDRDALRTFRVDRIGTARASGEELAARLGIARRTLRRYVAALQELGIPIEGERGVGGGYRIRPGYRLPPLMLSEDEVVAVVLGLLETRASRVPASAEVVDAALSKIYRVLPPALRRRVAALEATVLFTGSGDVEPIPRRHRLAACRCRPETAIPRN